MLGSMRRIRSAADVALLDGAWRGEQRAQDPGRSSQTNVSLSRPSADGRTHGHRSPPCHAFHRGRRSEPYLRSVADLSPDPLLRTKLRTKLPGWGSASSLVAHDASTGDVSAVSSPSWAGQQWVCALDFHTRGELLLSARVKKVIEVYNAWRLPDGSCCAQPVAISRYETPSKLATAAWCPWHDSTVTSGDYDGVINRIDVAAGKSIAEIDEHGGHRLRAVAHSPAQRGLVASCGDDGGIRLWGGADMSDAAGQLCSPAPRRDAGSSGAAHTAHPQARLLTVNGLAWRGQSEHELIAGEAGGCVAIWDLRNHSSPLTRWHAHRRPCSHVAEGPGGNIVTAGTDSTLRVWRADAGASLGSSPPAAACELSGHANCSHFVGLSVQLAGLVATGCEQGTVHVFDAAAGADAAATKVVMHMGTGGCVSSVAWERGSDGSGAPLLAAGTSDGLLRVLQLLPSNKESEAE
jgi:WD40 repeat protein